MAASATTPAAAQSPSVYGVWLTESKNAHVEIWSCAAQGRGPVCGRLVKLLNPRGPDGKPVAPEQAVDFRNADPALRNRKTLEMVFLYDFKTAREPNSFEEGTIYSAEDGKTYRANLKLQPDGTLLLRGYVGTPMFGRSQTWTRVQ
jgi:uncharacterized protein (DUF2147 family)